MILGKFFPFVSALLKKHFSNSSNNQTLGVLICDPSHYLVGLNCQVQFFNSEKDLFRGFIQLVISLDPDILLGFEVQHGSIGYLLERAQEIKIDLCSELSRLHDAPSNLQDPTKNNYEYPFFF